MMQDPPPKKKGQRGDQDNTETQDEDDLLSVEVVAWEHKAFNKVSTLEDLVVDQGLSSLSTADHSLVYPTSSSQSERMDYKKKGKDILAGRTSDTLQTDTLNKENIEGKKVRTAPLYDAEEEPSVSTVTTGYKELAVMSADPDFLDCDDCELNLSEKSDGQDIDDTLLDTRYHKLVTTSLPQSISKLSVSGWFEVFTRDIGIEDPFFDTYNNTPPTLERLEARLMCLMSTNQAFLKINETITSELTTVNGELRIIKSTLSNLHKELVDTRENLDNSNRLFQKFMAKQDDSLYMENSLVATVKDIKARIDDLHKLVENVSSVKDNLDVLSVAQSDKATSIAGVSQQPRSQSGEIEEETLEKRGNYSGEQRMNALKQMCDLCKGVTFTSNLAIKILACIESGTPDALKKIEELLGSPPPPILMTRAISIDWTTPSTVKESLRLFYVELKKCLDREKNMPLTKVDKPKEAQLPPRMSGADKVTRFLRDLD